MILPFLYLVTESRACSRMDPEYAVEGIHYLFRYRFLTDQRVLSDPKSRIHKGEGHGCGE